MNVLVGITAFGLLVLPHVVQETSTPRSEIELAYRSHVDAVSEWRTSISSDIHFLDLQTRKVMEKMSIKGVFDSDLIGVESDAVGEKHELLHLRRMEITIAADDEDPETIIMSRESMQQGDDVLKASEEAEIDAMLEALFGEPVQSFQLTPRGVEARMIPYGEAEEDSEIGEMGMGDEFPLLHPVLPEGPVAVGARWKGRREISSEYDFEESIETAVEYEFVDLADGIATLRAKARAEIEGPLTGVSEGTEFVFSSIVFEQESTIRFRVAEGALDAAETSFTFDATILPDEERTETVVMKSKTRIALERRPATAKAESAK